MNGKMVYKEFRIAAEDVTDSGEISGYGSVFNVIDTYGDIISPGAFSKSIARANETGRMPKMLAHHDWSSWPIGVWTEIREDDTGLFLRGRLQMDYEVARAAYSLMKAGALDGLSIGGFIPFDGWDVRRLNGEAVTVINEFDLYETSIVNFPANPDARITAVKHLGSPLDSGVVEQAIETYQQITRGDYMHARC